MADAMTLFGDESPTKKASPGTPEVDEIDSIAGEMLDAFRADEQDDLAAVLRRFKAQCQTKAKAPPPAVIEIEDEA